MLKHNNKLKQDEDVEKMQTRAGEEWICRFSADICFLLALWACRANFLMWLLSSCRKHVLIYFRKEFGILATSRNKID